MKTRFVSIATATLLAGLALSCSTNRSGSRTNENPDAYASGRPASGHDRGQPPMGNQRMMADMHGCPCCGRPMMGPPMEHWRMQHRELMQHSGEMMQHHEQMMARWKAMESELDQKIVKMNQATGQEKVDAMADVIGTMANQRKEIFNRIAAGHQRMLNHMRDMQKRMGGPEPGTRDTSPPPEEHE